jgi:hypothetical protein
MSRLQRRVRRTRGGDYELRLPSWERDALRSLPGQLRDLLGTDDPAIGRLFPPAYQDDPEGNAEYERLMRDDLVGGRQRSLEVMEATIDSGRLSEEQVVAWLGALNDLRLVLGTRLDITEETYDEEIPDDHPQALLYSLYFYLGWLEEQVVEELASGVDPAGTGGQPEVD